MRLTGPRAAITFTAAATLAFMTAPSSAENADFISDKPANPALRTELLRRAKLDRDARLAQIEYDKEPGASAKPGGKMRASLKSA